jgi:hypothetical protein
MVPTVGVQAQRGEHREMGVDRVGLALPAAGLAAGLLALDDRQAGGRDRACQADAEAAGVPSIDTTTRGPGARSRIQARNSAKPELSLRIFRVPIALAELIDAVVGVDINVGTGLVEVTEWHICDGSRPRADRLLIRPTGGPGRCRQPRRTGQMKGTPKRPDP